LTLPRLRVRGHVFELETGEPFTAIQCSDFNLFGRYCYGEDIEPVLAQRQAVGFNMLRCFTKYAIDKIGSLLNPAYGQIPEFLALCARYGLYVEFVGYTSTPDTAHWGQLILACRESTNVLLELVNEGDLPVNAIDMSRYTRPVGILSSHGSAGRRPCRRGNRGTTSPGTRTAHQKSSARSATTRWRSPKRPSAGAGRP
jgi:hypothetical protein